MSREFAVFLAAVLLIAIVAVAGWIIRNAMKLYYMERGDDGIKHK